MTCTLQMAPQDGIGEPWYAGDTIKYLILVLDEDDLPYAGTVIAAQSQIFAIVDGEPVVLAPPVIKTLGFGVTMLAGSIMEVIYAPTDTAGLPEAYYLVGFKAASADFGELTYIRRLKLEERIMVLT